MRGFVAAWVAGMAIVVWRNTAVNKKLPVPGAMAGVTGLFAAMALVADVAPQTRQVMTWAAWGLDIAGLLNILPAGLSGQISQAAQSEMTAPQAASPAARTGGAIGNTYPSGAGPVAAV